MLIEQNGIARAGNMRLKRQVSRQSKLEQRCAGRVGNNDPKVLALPERGAALLYDFGGALQGAVCRRVPIGKFDTLSIGDESAVVQMKMVSGDFNSLGWELCCLSVAEPVVIGDCYKVVLKCALFKGGGDLPVHVRVS